MNGTHGRLPAGALDMFAKPNKRLDENIPLEAFRMRSEGMAVRDIAKVLGKGERWTERLIARGRSRIATSAGARVGCIALLASVV